MSRAEHVGLVSIARHWLRKTRRCSVVVSEISTAGPENPDALGWYDRFSHLVECKTSRSDFLADRRKIFRIVPSRGMGNYRWYLTLPNVIRSEDELPDKWGWAELRDGKVKTIRKAEYQSEKATDYETHVLLSLLKRIGQDAPVGTSITYYTHTTKNQTVLEMEI